MTTKLPPTEIAELRRLAFSEHLGQHFFKNEEVQAMLYTIDVLERERTILINAVKDRNVKLQNLANRVAAAERHYARWKNRAHYYFRKVESEKTESIETGATA